MERRNRITTAIVIAGLLYSALFLLVVDLEDLGPDIRGKLALWLVIPLAGLTVLERWLHRRAS